MLERVAAVGALIGILYYPFSPLSADGHGIAFQYTLRYLTAPLAVAFVLGPIVFVSASMIRRIILAAFGALIALNSVSVTSRKDARVAARPARSPRSRPQVRSWPWPWWPWSCDVSTRRARRVAIVGVATIIVVVVVSGWFVQRRALEDRYADDGSPTAAVDAYFP